MTRRDAWHRAGGQRLPSLAQILRLGARPALDAARAATGSFSVLAELQVSWRVPASTQDAGPGERSHPKGQQGK